MKAIMRKMSGTRDSTKLGSISSLLKELKEFDRESGFVYFFRGHSRFLFKLIPSIYRDEKLIANENIIIKELMLRCPNDFVGHKSKFQSLVRMQHYSLPTRLLDITANPLIALYFASEYKDQPQVDGEILVFRIPKDQIKYFDSDTVSVLSNISMLPSNFALPDGNLDRAGFNDTSQIHKLLNEVRKEKPYFEPYIFEPHLESVVCVKPQLDNERIIKQEGAFLLFGVNRCKTRPAVVNRSWLPANFGSRRLLVNRERKAVIREQLEVLGITQAAIFPEIDTVADFIKQSYINSTQSRFTAE
jgi:hypothetical protein